jgi:hypothetical protein
LAGVSERMILVPYPMPFQFDAQDATRRLLQWVAELKFGAVVIVPSEKATEAWTPICTVARDSIAAEALIGQLQRKETFGPVVFANRYDGIDLPGDSCRLLVMD